LRSIPSLSEFIRQFKDLRGGQFRRSSDWVIGQGFKPAQTARRGDEDYQITSAPIVTRYPFLAADAFRPVALPRINAKRWPDRVVHRAGFGQGFIGPHIIIPQGVERSIGRVRAAYSEQSLVFEHSLQAITFPLTKRRRAKLLTAILNSTLAAWFYFHDTANLGTDRAKVHQRELLNLPFSEPQKMPDPTRAAIAAAKIIRLVDREIAHSDNLLQGHVGQVLEEIDSLVYDYYGLDSHDVALVEDTFRYMFPRYSPAVVPACKRYGAAAARSTARHTQQCSAMLSSLGFANRSARL
jgi:hypothetical protein